MKTFLILLIIYPLILGSIVISILGILQFFVANYRYHKRNNHFYLSSLPNPFKFNSDEKNICKKGAKYLLFGTFGILFCAVFLKLLS